MQSVAAFERAQRVLVGGVNSPVRAYAYGAVGGEPVFVDRAQGPFVFDIDGNRYVDLVGSWGPAIVGHAHPAVVEAVQRAAYEPVHPHMSQLRRIAEPDAKPDAKRKVRPSRRTPITHADAKWDSWP